MCCELTHSWRQRRGLAFGVVLTAIVILIPARPAHACTNGETQPCPLQAGVCAESVQTCVAGEWQACDYGVDFEEVESSCDRLDNDCDGLVDIFDRDGDGYGACFRPGVRNELLITGIIDENDDDGRITIFENLNGTYKELWSTFTDEGDLILSGGEAGDLTGDGLPEIALIRSRYGMGGKAIEVWSPNGPSEWSLLWQGPFEYYPFKVGEIADFDNDGINELLITDYTKDTLDLYSWDGNGFSVEATVRDCAPLEAHFIAGSGDLNNNGTPEILFQCFDPEDLMVHEFDGNGYPIIASASLPQSLYGGVMKVDDIDTGDLNNDGIADAVLCGNSGQGHVLTRRNGTYRIEFSTPQPTGPTDFAQTCSIGDMTNDGYNDFLVINKLGPKVFTHNGSTYEEVWSGGHIQNTPGIGESFIGDADNDGFTEFLFQKRRYPREVVLYENDTVGATEFENTYSFPTSNLVSIIIANLDLTNDEGLPMDCDDTDPSRGGDTHCGADYSRPAAGSGGGVGGTRWSDEFTVCNTAPEERKLLFTFTERGDPGQVVRKRTETISAGACSTFSDPVGDWFGEDAYGALLIDVMDGPAEDIRISGLFKGETEDGVMGQFFASSVLDDAVTTDAYILTTTDPEQNRLGTGFQAAKDGTDLEITLENPIGENHWRRVLNKNWKAGDNDLYGKIERHAPGVSNLVIHYKVNEGAVVPFGTITDNDSGDPAARGPAVPATSLVLPVIGKTSGAAGVDWFSEFLIANLTQEPNTVQLNLYIGRFLTGEIELGPGEVSGYGDLVSQIDWRDASDSPVAFEEGVGALEIVAEETIIAGSKFNSVDRETGRVMGLSLDAMAEPNVVPGSDYLFLGVRNKDETGVVRARLNFTNLTDEDATLSVDVLRQDGTLVGSFEKTARARRFNDWRIPKNLTEEGETYTLKVTSTQPGYAFLSQINESNDAICNYPLAISE